MEIESLYQKFQECSGVSIDTRTLDKGNLYFALKGENFDGNRFVKKAIEAGAKFCVVDDEKALITDNCILVKNTLSTLQQLANYHRKKMNSKIIALTGSNGKTTTKELIQLVLKSTFNTKATKGNFNNHIGVPLTLLSFTKDLDFGIVEMGANHLKEIEFLCEIAQPDFGLITNFGKAHLEGFGSVEGIIKGKSELYDYLKTNNKTIFSNTDDAIQITQISNYSNCITFGSSFENHYRITYNEANPFVSLYFNDSIIKSKLIGRYNFDNIAVAITIGSHFGVTNTNITKAIEAYKPNNNRSEVINKDGNTIILDAYNANPTSMLAALKNFLQLKGENKYLFLGDMFELGDNSELEHQSIADFASSNFENNIYLIGENFLIAKTKNSVKKFPDFELLKTELETLTINNATIIIKGSRGMALERILDFI